LSGSRISGTWHEMSYDVDGTITGRVLGESITVHLDAKGYVYNITIVTRNSSQSIDFAPENGDSRISNAHIELAR